MRWRTAVAVSVVLAGAVACSDGPQEHTAGGVPVRWYTAVDKALAEQPDVGSVGILQNGGPCPLRKQVILDGDTVSKVSDHGVVRIGRTVPALLCSWYEDTVVDVEVAHAADAAGYAALVAGTGAVDQPGNEQTEQDVVASGRTVRVVRIVYPTNPAAGTTLTATLLDEGARGRVRMEVHLAQEIDGYDEQAIAADLMAFLS
jgi:hypothetical protein